MSDWYRSSRDEDQRTYGDYGMYGDFGGRRREPYGRDRWSERSDYRTERRSFDEDEEGRFAGYGGYGGYGAPGWAPRREGAPGSAYGRQDFGGRFAYGAPRGDYAAGYGYPRVRTLSGSAYAGGVYGEAGPYGGPAARNPLVSRVADGDFEPRYPEHAIDEARDERRFGQHRGRGPKNYTRPDERIKEDISDRLCDDPFIDASEIDVAVKEGEVTLNGKVAQRFDKRRAEDIAEEVSGVKHVQCNLRVQPQAAAFQAQAHPAGDGQRRPASAT
jgi:osmotically-inducible protein OsmY